MTTHAERRERILKDLLREIDETLTPPEYWGCMCAECVAGREAKAAKREGSQS